MLCLFGFAGCGISGEESKTGYEQISQAEAKELMDKKSGYVILDVRTEEEFNAGHIENAVLIPDYEITEKAEAMLKDKNQLILVGRCRFLIVMTDFLSSSRKKRPYFVGRCFV